MEQLALGAGALHDMVVLWDSSLALDKASLVSSCPITLACLQRALGPWAGQPTLVAKNLGIDYSAGCIRAKWVSKSTRRKRMAHTRARMAKLSMFIKARISPKKLCPGIIAGAAYGAQVTGLTSTEVWELQQQAARTMTPLGKGASVLLKLLCHSDPVAQAACAAAGQWALEVWRNMMGDPRAHSLGLLSRAWAANQRCRATAWARVRGPLDAIGLELDRIGWSWPSPFQFQDDLGRLVSLTQHSHLAVKKLLRAGHTRTMQQQAGAKLGLGRVSLSAVTQACKSSAFPADLKAPLITWACGGWWTGHRMLQAGYLVTGLCTCGQPDTIFHKLWQCQHTAELRQAFAAPALQCLVKQDCCICTRGLLAHPGQLFPSANQAFMAEFLAVDHNGLGLVQEEDFGLLHGPIYTDGSYDKGPHPEMGRAAWAVVQVGPKGHPLKIIRGPVPAGLPQNAVTAEWMAAAVAIQYLGEGELYIDCSAVVGGLQEWLDGCPKLGKLHSGFLVFIRNQTAKPAAVHKVKAHRTKAAAQSHEDLASITANGHADSQAKFAMGLHPSI